MHTCCTLWHKCQCFFSFLWLGREAGLREFGEVNLEFLKLLLLQCLVTSVADLTSLLWILAALAGSMLTCFRRIRHTNLTARSWKAEVKKALLDCQQ